MDLQAMVNDAAALHRSGRFAEALVLYRRVLLIRPSMTSILSLAAEAMVHGGAPGDGARVARRAVAVEPGKGVFHKLLAYASTMAGDLSNAERAYAGAFRAEPGNLDILSDWASVARARDPAAASAVLRRLVLLVPHLGEAWRRFGEADAASNPERSSRSYRVALRIAPGDAPAWRGLGLVGLAAKGNEANAENAFRHAALVAPEDSEAYRWLATSTSEILAAVPRFRRASMLAPADLTAWFGLANACYRGESPERGERAYRRVAVLEPGHADAYANRLVILTERNTPADAVRRGYRRLLALAPLRERTLANIAKLHMDRGENSEAERYVRRSLVSGRFERASMAALAGIYRQTRRIEAAMRQVRRSELLFPENAALKSTRLMDLSYSAGVTAEQLYRAHRDWAERWAASERPLGYDVDKRPDRQLRLGFLSPDLRRHPVGYFMKPLLGQLDRAGFELFLYSDCGEGDDLTSDFRTRADHWRDTAGLGHEPLRQRILDDRIDILFDLAGHSSGNRMEMFAMRAAPLQMTWMGYVGTTGLRTMDYLVTDRFQTRPGTEDWYGERWLVLPDDYICFEPVPEAPEVAPSPAGRNGFVTFGSFNNPAKLSDRSLDLWGRVLEQIPGSELLLAYRGFNDPGLQREIREFLSARKIEPERIRFSVFASHEAFLAGYGEVDIALDTLPYSGGLTTCEALWMGVPVVTLSTADHFAGRHSVSHLTNAGFPEWVADSDEAFFKVACGLGSDPGRLADLRATLRQRVADSPLCDRTHYADAVAAALRMAWQRYCAAD
ncbi:hypothetical protein NUH88_06595 [Nisaea acidiphila]|uniref:protein O-GlcNAc transferase n=1 Tax=Nisaea acidiphila TaxID=1862145 RepID=A0A9J7AVJ3_9PROT|nr:hypothetical protein [Nisaea acidiphila]UUX51359.1 hypothetical protein NUH88_06595 [Nisaea acidiphila]